MKLFSKAQSFERQLNALRDRIERLDFGSLDHLKAGIQTFDDFVYEMNEELVDIRDKYIDEIEELEFEDKELTVEQKEIKEEYERLDEVLYRYQLIDWLK